MKLIELTQRINQMHRMIDAENTGDPESFAHKLGIGKRQLYNILDDLRLMGAPISYDIRRRTYRYVRDYRISVEIKMEVLDDDDLNNVNGGYFLTECNFIALDPDKFAHESIGQLACENEQIY